MLTRYALFLMTDITNFFHTIYSHSLPWAVLGKQHVKRALSNHPSRKRTRRTVDQRRSSQIDRAIQRGNSRRKRLEFLLAPIPRA